MSRVFFKWMVWVILTLTLSKCWVLRQIDVNNVFLNGFIDQPLGFVQGDGLVWRLRKDLYGIKQVSRAWFSKLNSCLLHLDFVASQADSSLFILANGVYYIVVLISIFLSKFLLRKFRSLFSSWTMPLLLRTWATWDTLLRLRLFFTIIYVIS